MWSQSQDQKNQGSSDLAQAFHSFAIPHSSRVNVDFMYKQVLACMQFKHSLSFSLQFDDILEFGWQEVNQGTRNLIQKNVSWRRKFPEIPPLELMPNAN